MATPTGPAPESFAHPKRARAVTLPEWRDRILTAVLITFVIGGFVAWLPSSIMAVRERLWGVIVVATGAYGLLILLLVARHLSFRTRGGLLVGVVYLLGAYFTVDFGPFAAGLLWLFAFPVLTAILFGVRLAWWALGFTAVTLGAIAVGLIQHRLDWVTGVTPGIWAVICGSFLALDALVAISVGVLLEGLSATASALEHQLAERARIEEQLRQSAKLEALGRLAGGVAHDFNNILTVILGSVELLRPRFEADDPDGVELAEIANAAQRAAGLTRQLLAFSRQQIIQPQLLDVGSVVVGVEPMLRRLIRENVELRIVGPQGLSPVRADAGQLEQVVLNLAVNGADAMPDGGVLTIEVASATVDSEFAGRARGIAPGAYVMLAVTDTGVGIDEALQQRIFEPFFTTKEPGRGTGLGLAMVYGVVKQSGGDVWAYSEPGRGSIFKVYLPAVSGQLGAAPVESIRATSVRGQGEALLVLEDDVAVRALVSRQLRQRGYRVEVAADAEDAVRILSEQPDAFRLLLTDVVMPGMSGPEVVALVRRKNPGLRVLYMSGYTDDAFERDAVFAQGEGFLQKPFSDADLAMQVRRLVDLK